MMKVYYLYCAACALVISLISSVEGSAGDGSYTFQKCAIVCKKTKCKEADDVYLSKQPLHKQLLQWTCPEECHYDCMWKTVEAYQKDHTRVPQFFGKWPFIRVLGIQEPASVVFSILNGLSHVFSILQFRRLVPFSAPLYYMWHVYAMIAINAWSWSTIFHTRDFPLTEMMDYFCALSLVLSNVFLLCVRVLGTKAWWKPGLCGVGCLAFFFYHIHYLAFIKFDYGYNMEVNLFVGGSNTVLWWIWCWKNKKQPHVRKAAASLLFLASLLCLELLDFPPIWWIFDAHSLWHASTAPVTFLWYSFVIDDCLYLHNEEEKRGKIASGESLSDMEMQHHEEEKKQL